ncbi:MAG: MoaD/ThiS family protein [Actinomycetia bacterium]|nr:MoaD/ThiS family protein [Actinomycetes bacterium]
MVSVRIPTVLRPAANGQSEVEVGGATVGEVVKGLVAEYPGLEATLIDDAGAIRKFVNVYVNDEDIRFLDKLETEVNGGDEVTILPAVAGG